MTKKPKAKFKSIKELEQKLNTIKDGIKVNDVVFGRIEAKAKIEALKSAHEKVMEIIDGIIPHGHERAELKKRISEEILG